MATNRRTLRMEDDLWDDIEQRAGDRGRASWIIEACEEKRAREDGTAVAAAPADESSVPASHTVDNPAPGVVRTSKVQERRRSGGQVPQQRPSRRREVETRFKR